ncbi:MAG: tRNA (adenosine(37)-N6)-threonylcarbamoyltransferase complex dimerization subunit type 1 TsaB [Nitrospirota bacterium]
MRLLAIETATAVGGVAIMEDDLLIAESRANVKVTHSERLLTEIDHALTSSRLTIDAIDVFALSTGPGSFTGLRVGLSTLKGLAYATAKKVVAVPTLEAFASAITFTPHMICPLLDARRREVYAGVFAWEGDGLVRILPEQAVKLETLLARLHEPVVFLGEGAALYRKTIEEIMGERALFARPRDMAPSPATVAALGMQRARSGAFEDPVRLTPLYLRKSEAELKSPS